jgi:hypothetical protein
MHSCLLPLPEDRPMTHQRTTEVLYETEATLRLVDRGLDGLRDDSEPRREAAIAVPCPGELSEVPAILEHVNVEILAVLARLCEVRDAIGSGTLARLATTQERIPDVALATEGAVLGIMDAHDRATRLVDDLDAIDAEQTPDRTRAAVARGALRDELFLMLGALQFQDIMAQQLADASAVLTDTAHRLGEITCRFGGRCDDDERARRVAAMLEVTTGDPHVSARDAASRQALADEIFRAVCPNAA